MPEETETTDPAITETVPGETPANKPRTAKAPPGVLQRESDIAVRPGFRSPANKNSKAQKKKKK